MDEGTTSDFSYLIGKKIIIYARNGYRFKAIILRIRTFGNNEFVEFKDRHDGKMRLFQSAEISNIEVEE